MDMIIRQTAQQLGKAGVETPLLDARLLVQAAAELSHADIIREPQRRLNPDQLSELEVMTARRITREPVSRILGQREFYGLDFLLSPHVLDPRPDSELLVETALAALEPRKTSPLRLIDLGTGSGCLLISLLTRLSRARGVGVDISPQALDCARRNAARLGVAGRASFVCASWLSAVKGPYDVLIANPPYIRSGDVAGLQPEVARFDPVLALDGGGRGLDPYEAILSDAARVLAPGAMVFFEIGDGQANDVMGLLRRGGVVEPCAFTDLGGKKRVVGGQFTGNSS